MPEPSPTTRQLTVAGHGRTSLPPDEALVTLGVEIVRSTASEARAAAAEAMEGVVAAVRSAGVGAADVRTTDLSLGPEIEYSSDGKPRRTGFRLTNRVAIRVADPDRVAAVVDGAVAGGATSVDGVAFRVRDESEARRSALAAAVEDARASAEALATAAGAGLGSVIAVREASTGGPLPVARMAMLELKAADTPVLGGTSEIAASVEVTWELLDAR
jgi:uncharacterized protein